MAPVVFNHFGHCVSDLDRSVRFYCEAFGFAERNRITVPDQPTAQLLRLEPPVGLSAVYLVKDGTTLELLYFGERGGTPARDRPFDEPGLTHMSFGVEDMAGALTKVVELGGQVINETDIGVAIFVRDPDGQPLELIDLTRSTFGK